jgi:protein phosphatase
VQLNINAMNSSQSKIEVGARSETGYVRNENQDRMSRTEVPLGQLYVIADGMGGHKGGAIAAELTVKGLVEFIGAEPASAPVKKVIWEAFKKVNQTVHQKAHSNDPATEKMGSTAVLLLISGKVARLAHVGDSRAYLYRKRQLHQLTTDHTIVQKMVEAGMLIPEEAANHPDASVLERAIGSKPSVEVDISDELTIHSGDAILLCSDGLSSFVADAEIQEILRSPTTVQQVTEELVNLALEKGGEDNITVQFIQYGPRKEEDLIRKTKPQPIHLPGGQEPWHRPFQRAAALIVIAVISYGAIYFFHKEKLGETEAQLQKLQEQSAEYRKNLHEVLLRVDIQRAEYRSELDKRQQLVQQTENSSRNTQSKLTDIKEQLTNEQKSRDELSGQLEIKEKELKSAEIEVKNNREKLAEAKKLSANVRFIFLSEANATERLIKDDVIKFAREVGSLNIRWITIKEFEDLQISVPNELRTETKIYFTEEINANQNAKKLIGNITKIKAAMYSPEEKNLKSAIEARFGKSHVLVVIGVDERN